MNKQLKTILILVALLIVALAVIFINIKLKQATMPEPNSGGNGSISGSDPTALWLTYKNDQYKFGFKYPPDYTFNQGVSPRFNVGEFFSGTGKNVVTVSLPESSYPGTNYYDGFLTVSVALGTSTLATCQLMQQEGDTQSQELTVAKVVNGIKFYAGQTGGAAAGTFSTNEINHAFINGVCYEISLNLFQGNIGNYPAGAVKQIDEADVFNKLTAVLNTFKINNE